MQLAAAAARLERHRPAIEALVAGVPEEDARWKPEGTQWSILEVVNHLLDEERDDFRRRLSMVLEDPTVLWPPIDPVGWVTARSYNTRGLAPSLAAWREERDRSLAWLRGIRDPDLDRAYDPVDPEGRHVQLRGMRAGDLLLSWVAHDLLHIRQLGKIHVLRAAETAGPYSFAYAGNL